MEFLPEGYINQYIAESSICICHVHICMYIHIYCLFPCALSRAHLFSLCVCVLCRKSWRTTSTWSSSWSSWRSNDHKYRQHTHKQRSREGETRPQARARASSRANGTHLPVWASFLFFLFIHFTISNEMWHLAEKVWPTWGWPPHRDVLPTICSNSSLCSAAYSIVRLQLQLVTQLLNGQEPRRVEWTRHIGLALIRFAWPGGEGGRGKRGVGDVPAAMAAQTSGFTSFSRKYNTHHTHIHMYKSLWQRDSNNPNKAKQLNSWSCFIWFQPQIHFSRRWFAVGCCERALSALAVNQIRWWFSACLWLQSHFPFLIPHFPFFPTHSPAWLCDWGWGWGWV